MIWNDANQDVQTDMGELKTLSEMGVKEIDLRNIVKPKVEIYSIESIYV